MDNIAIKRWGPIVDKLDPTNSLTDDQIASLCNYAQEFSNVFSVSSLGLGDLSKSLLPMLLKIVTEVSIQLHKLNIPFTFSNDPEPEPEIKFENDTVSLISKSDFEMKHVAIKTPTLDLIQLKSLGINVQAQNESLLIKLATENLVQLATEKGNLCLHVTGNTINEIIENDQTLMLLTYKIKK